MKVLVLTPSLYDTSPGPRFRIEQWARYLQDGGFTFTFFPFEDTALHRVIYQNGEYPKKAALMLAAFRRRLDVLKRVREFDLVFLHREAALVGPPWFEQRLVRCGVPLIYDFDDPIWLSYHSPTNPFFSRFKWSSKVASICKLATRVIVGNRLLADWASQHARRVDVVPSTIDMKSYPPKPVCNLKKTVTLGWTGSHSTLPFLESLLPTLKRLATKHSFELRVISHTDALTMDVGPAMVTARKWSSTTEAVDLHDMDIGLAPFPNTGWTPWRCHGKVLQYMAVGMPTIASPIGIVPDYVMDGVNGELASTEEDWIEKLSKLIENPDERRRQGMAGRQMVQERYSAEVWAPKIQELFESTV